MRILVLLVGSGFPVTADALGRRFYSPVSPEHEEKTVAHNRMSSLSTAGFDKNVRVGISTRHGMADEMSKYPPAGIEYVFPEPTSKRHRLIRSPIKAYLMRFDKPDVDLMEAVLCPIITDVPWICSLDCFQAAIAFNLRGIPLPKWARVNYLFRQDSFRKMIFWSKAALETLTAYGGVTDRDLIEKSTVVYPAVREVPNDKIRYTDRDVNILFSGDFFRKGGVNVVDAFEELQKRFPGIKLRVCCDEKIDFNTPNQSLRNEYLGRLKRNPAITLGRVSRDVMVDEILPDTDIYLLPSYNEAFGFALLEAMAFGIPVISTNHFAIPEIVEHDRSGFLVDFCNFDPQKIFRGYVVDVIPPAFHRLVTEQLTDYLGRLIESVDLRSEMGQAGLFRARAIFSFEARNRNMSEVYARAVGYV